MMRTDPTIPEAAQAQRAKSTDPGRLAARSGPVEVAGAGITGGSVRRRTFVQDEDVFPAARPLRGRGPALPGTSLLRALRSRPLLPATRDPTHVAGPRAGAMPSR